MAQPAHTLYAVGAGQPIRAGRWPGGHLLGGPLLAAMVAAGALGTQASGLSGDIALADLLAGGTMDTAPSQNAVVVGDSLTDEGYGALHTFTGLNAYAGGPLRLVANLGVAGETVSQVLARMDNSYTASSPGLAGLTNLGWVFIRVGTNNTRSGATITGTVQTAYQDLIAKCLTYAKRVVLMAVPPISSPESGAGVNSYNTWLASYCPTVSGCYFINDTTTVNDGTGAWASGYAPADGIHYGAKAASRMTIDGYASFAALVAPFGYTSPLITDPADIYPAQPQWATHPMMDGTSGTAGGGFTGQVPTGWTVNGYGSGFSGTCSIVPADVGDPINVPWLRITPASIGSGGGAAISITAAMSGRTITNVDPATLEHALQVRFNGFDGTRFTDLKCYAYGTSNETIGGMSRFWMGDASLSGIVVPRIATRRKSPIAHSSAYFQAYLTPSSAYTGSVGSVDIRRLSVRG